jgi:drug/metabolite transporter (DMT)-like permease
MGFVVALLSAMSSTAKDIVSKTVASKVHADVSTFASFTFALPFYLLILAIASLCGGEPLAYSGSFLMLVLARSITDVFAEGLKMKAFAAGDISLVSSFLALSPLILALLSPYVTGDKVTVYDGVALILIVTGSLLAVRRDARTGAVFQGRAIVLAFLASFAFALNSCFDRLAVVSSGALVSGFAMTLLAALFCLPLVLRQRGAFAELKNYHRPFLLRGALETLFMVTKLLALTTLEAHVVLGITRASHIFSVLSGRLFFGERDTGRRMLAAVFVYLGLMVLIMSRVWGA